MEGHLAALGSRSGPETAPHSSRSVFLLPVILALSVLAGILPSHWAGHLPSEFRGLPPPGAGWRERKADGLKPGMEFFFRQRLFGNSNVDPAQRQHAALDYAAGLRKPPSLSGTVTWSPLGPGNMAGRIRALILDPADEAILYAGSASGGVFRSTNSGLAWTPLMDDSPALSVGALAVDPRNPSVLFVGTGEPVVFLSKAITLPTFGGVGILKSTDAGAHWSRMPWAGRTGAVTRILVNPVSSDTLLVATRENLHKSGNGGTSWQTSVLPGVVTDIAYKESDPSVVFAAVGNDFGSAANGVYRSDAGGERYTWKRLDVNFPGGDSTGRIVLATTPHAPRLLFALVAKPITAISAGGQTQYGVTDKDFLALLRSSNDGETWERIETNLPADFAQGQAFYNFCIGVSPADSNLLFVGGIELYRSQDGGRTFFPVSFGGRALHIDQHVVCFAPTTGIAYVGNDGGVYRTSSNGNEWQSLGATLETIQFYSIAIDRHNPQRRFGGTQDNGLLGQQLQTKTWMTILGDIDAGNVAIDSNTIYAMGTLSIFPYRSTNGGQSWTSLSNGFRGGDRPNWLQPLLLHPNDPSMLYTATQCVYEARDAGNPDITPVWRAISPDLSAQSTIYESIVTTLAIPPSRGTWMYAGTGDGKAHRCEDISAAAPAWIDISSGLPKRWITRLAVHPEDPRSVFATVSGYGSGHVFESTDAGATWTDISGNLPDVPVNAIVVAQAGAAAVLCIGTDIGVWQRTADGTWAPLGTGLPNVVVYDLVIDRDYRLIAATHGRGMWISQAVVSAEDPPLASGEPIILAMHPLPATSRSALTISIVPSALETEVQIRDMRGSTRRVMRIPPGIRSMPLRIGDLPAGVYFLNCVRAKQSVVRKFAVVR